jgi:flagellar biosynthetic protein FliQ
MSQDGVLDVFRQALLLALKLAGPLLLVSIIIGLVISIFQAATQIHEQTLTFVPKVLVIALLLLAMGSWMMSMMDEFVQYLFQMIAAL